jgi:hypothetical protein
MVGQQIGADVFPSLVDEQCRPQIGDVDTGKDVVLKRRLFCQPPDPVLDDDGVPCGGSSGSPAAQGCESWVDTKVAEDEILSEVVEPGLVLRDGELVPVAAFDEKSVDIGTLVQVCRPAGRRGCWQLRA